MSTTASITAPPAGTLPAKGGGAKGWFSRNWSYFAAFFLPVVLIYIAYAIFGLYPFGDHSVLCLDLNGQYVYYFEAIRDAFHGDGSILYNWSRNLSGGYQGVIGYYLASPFTLIVILLPRTMILGALFIMILAKLGAASLTFSYYLRKARHIAPLPSVIFGTMFGMCAYGIIQTIDPMWLDGLVLLPLIALGIEYLVDDGRKLNYIIPLALMCVANFYIGFMICIFTAIYFVLYTFFISDKVKMDPKELAIIVLRMVISTVVVVCLAAFMILPVYNALKLGKFDFTKPDYSFKAQFKPLEFFAQFCVNCYNTVDVQGMPEIYSGVLAFLCLPLFFMNGRIPLRKKFGFGLMLASLVISMYCRPIDMRWHGGQMPNWLPFRYSFIFSFVLLTMTAMTMKYIRNIKKAMLAGVFAVYFVLLLLADSRHYESKKGEYIDTFQTIWMTIIFLAIYAVLVYLLSRRNPAKNMSKYLMLSLMAVCCCELTYNAVCEFNDIHKDVAYSTRKSYRQYIQSGRDLVDRLYAEDPSFYRAEKTYTRTVNDNAGFRLRGLTHSSSVMNTKILKFIETMGYSCRSYYSRYDGNTPLADSLLGIKYVLDKGDDNKNVLKAGVNSDLSVAYQKKFSEVCKSQSESDINVDVYENPNALGLGYMVSKDIKKVKFFGNDDPFNSQNILMSTITGNTVFTEGGGFESWTHYYYPLPITEELRFNECYQDMYGSQYRYREDGWSSANPTQHQPDPTVDFFFEAQSDDPIYLFFKTENESKVNLWLSDQWNKDDATKMKNTDGTDAKSLGSYFETDNYKILYVGTFPKGQKLQLRMTLLTDSNNTKEKYTIIKQHLFYHFDAAKFQEDIDTLKGNQWDLTTFGGRTLEGKITAKEGQIMMTSVPEEPGWTVWVDGKKQDYVTLFQAMIGIELEPGEHTVKMQYTSPGLKLGLMLFGVGAVLAALLYVYDRKNNKTLALIKENKKNGIYELPYEDDPEPKESNVSFAQWLAKLMESDEQISAPPADPGNLEKPISGVAEQTAESAAPVQQPKTSLADELKKLKELLDDGALTQEEFDALKKELLNPDKK